MILFSGHGNIANEFAGKYPCEVMSLRNMSSQDLEKLLANYAVIIHNAANLHPANIEEATNDNFLLTKKIIDILERVNPKAKFLYLSSMSILKSMDEYVNPLEMNSYAFSKYLGEIYTLACQLKNASAIRFSTIFYANPSKDGLSKLIWEATLNGRITLLNGGSAKRDFIPVEILVEYLYKISNLKTASRAYTICSGTSTSFAQAADTIRKKLKALVIEYKTLENVPSVLTDFSIRGLQEVGIIDFELDYFIAKYIKKLSES